MMLQTFMPGRKTVAALLLSIGLLQARAAVTFQLGQASPAVSQTSTIPAAANPLSTLDWLQFLDGSSLHGRLVSMDIGAGIQWNHPDAIKPAQFKPSNIDSISFEASDRVSLQHKATCKFRFVNGDELVGNLIGIDEKKITFDSWIGHNLEAERSSVQSIGFQGFSVLYEGPTGMAGWSLERANPYSWQYRDGSFVTTRNGVLGRDLKLPGNASIEFDLAWNNTFVLLIPLYTEVIDRFDFNNSCYVLYLGGNAIGLQRVHPNGGGITYLGTTIAAPVFAKKNRAHVEIRVNKEESRFAVYVDGVLLGKWRDDNGFVGAGTGLAFSAQMAGPLIKISNIRISETDGKTEELNAKPSTEDALYLANKDRVGGTIGTLRDGKLGFSSWQTSLQVPMQRIREIVFAAVPRKSDEKNPWKVRVNFSGGGALSLALDKWTDKEVSGTHPSFGRVTFDPKTVRQLEFNPDRLRSEDQSDSEDSASKPATASATDDMLLFENGDVLLGAMHSLEPKTSLQWKRADALEPIEFAPAHVSEIRLRSREQGADLPSRIHFFDGDEFQANIVAVDSDKVSCEGVVAGKVQLPRRVVRALTPAPPQRSVTFKGPEGLEGWTMGKVTTVPDAGQWSYSDGAFLATKSSAIARDVNLPDRASIQFDLAWKGSLGVAVALYTSYLQPINLANKESEPEFGGFYSLQLNNTYNTQLISVKKHDNGGNPTLGIVTVPAFHQKNSARIEVRVDKKRRLIALLVDGTLINRWFDVEGFAGTGTAVRFVHHGTGSVKLNNLLVTDWDGQFEEPLAAIATNKVDIARLRNGDQVEGTIGGLRDDQLVLTSTESKKMEIPWKRVKQVEFKKVDDRVSRDTNGAVQGYYARGGSIKFMLEKWSDQGIFANSPNFGRLILNPAAFDRIRLKPDKEAAKAPDESAPTQ